MTTGFLIACLVLLAGVVTGNLLEWLDAAIIGLVGLMIMASIGVRMSRPEDAAWLPKFVAAGYVAKITYSVARYFVLEVIYNGSGDAVGYHGSGHRLSEVWRSFQVPPDIELGTEFVNAFTGLLYVPYRPTMIGGFFMYATLAYLGHLLLYAAFREAFRPRRLKWYAAAVFFLPAISYWPSSIGKESLMFLGIGLASYGIARFLNTGQMGALFISGSGLIFAGVIRPHMSALIVGSFALTLLIAKHTPDWGFSSGMRWTAVLLVGVASLGFAGFAASEFNIDLQGDVGSEVDEFVGNLEGNTGRGGSVVEGGAVSGPQDIPEATLRILFRPLPHEAHNVTALASSLESAVLLLIVIWRSPKIIKNTFRTRDDPYVLMSVIMTFTFVIMFSPFLNLGLIARERSQIIPFLMIIVIQLGWDFVKDDEKPGDLPRQQTARIPA